MSQGTFLATALRTLPRSRGLAMPLASAGKVGRLSSQSSGSSRRAFFAIARRAREIFAYWAKIEFHFSRIFAPRAPTPSRKARVDARRAQELRVFGPAVNFLGEFDFVVAERLAVGLVGVCLCGEP